MLRGVYHIMFIAALFMSGITYAASDVLGADFHDKDKSKRFFETKVEEKGLNAFSLRSGLQFRGEKVIDNSEATANYLSLNTLSSNKTKGQMNYTFTYNSKKKLVQNRVTFNPNEAIRNYGIR
ncbi:MAG: hypothetical protein QM727_13075 [Niabella sp.]